MMAARPADDSVLAVQEMQEARYLLARLRPLLQKRQESILVQLVQGHRDNSLSEGQIRGAIGALSEHRSLIAELERHVRLGEQASEKIHGHRATPEP